MQLRELLQSLPAYIAELERLQASHSHAYQRHKVIYGKLNADDLFLHKKVFAQQIIASIKQQTFSYQPLHQSVLAQRDKQRIIYPHFISDHIVQRLIHRYLAAKVEAILSDHLFSYRKGYSDTQARQMIARYIKQQTRDNKLDLYIAQTDLSNYTDSIVLAESKPLWQCLAPYREDDYTWQLIQTAVRAIYCDHDTLYSKLIGVPMGSPLTPLVANLYLNELDHQFDALKDILYLRFGDDILVASPDPTQTTAMMDNIKQHCHALELTINSTKTKSTYLTRAGRAAADTNYIGNSKLDYLGHSIFANGEIFLKPKKENELLKDIRQKIYNAGALLDNLPTPERGKALCEMLNNTILNSAATSTNHYLEKINRINHRSLLRRLDYSIALEVAKYLSNTRSVKAFRMIPYKMIRQQYGLLSLCQLKNETGHHGKY